MTDSTGLAPFTKEFPSRFFDVGIAEGHAVTFAAGLARGGFKPFVVIYSSFLQRSYDNIIHDVALQKLPVVFCLDRAGFVGEDGPTHHGVFDISYMRQIPGMVVIAPKDENELRDMLLFAANYHDGPVSIRYPRGGGTAQSINNHFNMIEIGKAEVLMKGSQATVLAIGEMVSNALEAGRILLEKGIKVSVVNMRFVHPLDSVILNKIQKSGKPIITVEENIVAGGFGSAVMEYYSGKGCYPVVTIIGIPNEFGGQAKRAKLIHLYALDAIAIAERIRKVLVS
jgi:1-deoxy-D-xylulose-5-phosphate synthase